MVRLMNSRRYGIQMRKHGVYERRCDAMLSCIHRYTLDERCNPGAAECRIVRRCILKFCAGPAAVSFRIRIEIESCAKCQIASNTI